MTYAHLHICVYCFDSKCYAIIPNSLQAEATTAHSHLRRVKEKSTICLHDTMSTRNLIKLGDGGGAIRLFWNRGSAARADL